MRGLCLGLALLAGPVAAQGVDCANPVTQSDMNHCSYFEWRAADAQLNDRYAQAIAAAREMALYSDRDVEEELRAAQRAWVAFRDLACEVEGLLAEGGSMQPMIRGNCMTRLTWARIVDLEAFIDF